MANGMNEHIQSLIPNPSIWCGCTTFCNWLGEQLFSEGSWIH